VCLVEQDAHQLRHSQTGMSIVELDRHLGRERAPIAIAPAETPDEVGERAGDEKVLLHEA
jgi:hypothetical protein